MFNKYLGMVGPTLPLGNHSNTDQWVSLGVGSCSILHCLHQDKLGRHWEAQGAHVKSHSLSGASPELAGPESDSFLSPSCAPQAPAGPLPSPGPGLHHSLMPPQQGSRMQMATLCSLCRCSTARVKKKVNFPACLSLSNQGEQNLGQKSPGFPLHESRVMFRHLEVQPD